MHYVYLLRSESNTKHTYIGSTSDLEERLASHNSGANGHTARFRPWKLAWYCAFPAKQRAEEFEKYLEHGSGHAFAKRHLW